LERGNFEEIYRAWLPDIVDKDVTYFTLHYTFLVCGTFRVSKKLITQVQFRDLEHAQQEIDKFREYYNNKRPHGDIAYTPPARRYNKKGH